MLWMRRRRRIMIARGGRHGAGHVPGGVRLWMTLVRLNGRLRAACPRRSFDGFLKAYNPTVSAMRARFAWFPMPTFGFREWLVGLIAGVAPCFALTPLAARNARWLRPLAWFYALVMFFKGLGHTAVTILGHTVASVPVARPAPGFYSSPLLFIGSVWLMVRLWKTASRSPALIRLSS
jgi:hypothetical protein